MMPAPRKVPWLHEMFGVPPFSEPFSALYGWPRWWWAYVLAMVVFVAVALIWGLQLRAEADMAEAARLTAGAPHRELVAAQAEVARLTADDDNERPKLNYTRDLLPAGALALLGIWLGYLGYNRLLDKGDVVAWWWFLCGLSLFAVVCFCWVGWRFGVRH